MVTVKRPSRLFSFTDFSKSQPKQQQPGDRLDAQFIELIDAIRSTQDALAEVRQDDGTTRLRTNSDEMIARAVADVIGKTNNVAANVASIAANALESERSAQLFAADAERCVRVMTQLISDWNAIRALAKQAADAAQRSSDSVDMFATEAEDWANYSQAQADNAIAAKDEALQWAEYLAGPVVDAAQAPAYIAGSKFPGGLYYQPVEGGVAGLFSAKWWALQAYNLVGTAGFYYLGAWPYPPSPGEIDPVTGQRVPDPLAPGTIVYDEAAQTLKVWNGTAWVSPVSLVQAYASQFVYIATAGQTTFSGADHNGATPIVGSYGSDVHVNGVRLILTDDYTVDAGTSALTIRTTLRAGDTVQWDLLVSPTELAPGALANIFKINPITPDGVTQDFPLQYVSGASTIDAAVGDSAQVFVSLDGAPQEPGKDYSASGASIHFSVAPDATAAIWMVWYSPVVS